MEDLEQSSLEEKVDIENLVLFPLDSYVNKETEEENFRIKDEPSEIKTNDDISENYDIKKETIELPFDEYEKEPIEFSTNSNEMGQKEEEAISFNTETPTPALQDYSALKIVHQGDEQINKSIQGIPPKKNMNFETTMKTQNEKKTSRSNFLLKEDWNQYCQRQKKLLCEQQNASLIEKARVDASKKFLKRHIATAHEGKMQEKKFKCTLCDDVAFTQKHNLTKHIESFHEGKKAFVCNICDLRFTQNGG
jgi:hypothetical protein